MDSQCIQFNPSMRQIRRIEHQPDELKGPVMNLRQILVASAITLVGSTAFAVEGEQWKPEAGTLTRAEVRAELARAQAAGEVNRVSASYGDVAVQAMTSDRSRAEVRAEAAMHRFDPASLYYGG
jgi:hypothetical protein